MSYREGNMKSALYAGVGFDFVDSLYDDSVND